MFIGSAMSRTGSCARWLAIAAVLTTGSPALAGDEDLSPNAYQEFDPVTGFMVTVDPDADAGHGDETLAQAEQPDATDTAIDTDEADTGNGGWLYWVITGIAGVGVLAWLRRKAAVTGN